MVSTKRLFDAASNSCVQERKNRTVGSTVAGPVPCHPRAHSGHWATSCVRGFRYLRVARSNRAGRGSAQLRKRTWPESREATKQMKKHNFFVSKTESTIRCTKPAFHNFGSNPLRAELARSGAILINSL